MKKDNRIEIIRIIAIVLVVLLHVTNRYLLKAGLNDSFYFLAFINSITRISVPIFLMISGAVNIPKKFDKKKYYLKILRMCIILTVWTLIYYLFENYKLVDLIHSVFSFMKPHLWYMYALIGLYIATPFISKMVINFDLDEEKLFAKLWLFFSGFYYLAKIILPFWGIDTNITHPIPLFNATYYLGYYVIGYLIYKNINKISDAFINIKGYIIIIGCFVINAILTILGSYKINNYYQGFFGYSNLLIILPSIICFTYLLKTIKGREYLIIKYICPYILGIYLLHILILDLLMKYLNISSIILGCFVYSISTFIISYVLIYIIKMIPYINRYIC